MTTSQKPPLITRKIIRQMVARIVERFHPDKIVLFGSCARGDITYDSDVDLLVIMPVVRTRREAAKEIYLSLMDFPVPTDIIVNTPEDVEEYGELVGTILRPALREGRVMYENLQH